MTQPNRPWWRKKRWWAVVGLWALTVYPAGLPPVYYAVGRRWIGPDAYLTYIRPFTACREFGGDAWTWCHVRLRRCRETGSYHRRLGEYKEVAGDPAINRTHWAPPASDEAVNRTHWTPPTASSSQASDVPPSGKP